MTFAPLQKVIVFLLETVLFIFWVLFAIAFSIVIALFNILLPPLLSVDGARKKSLRLWAKAIVYASLSRVHFYNAQKLPEQGPFIIITNHQSMLDIFVNAGFFQRSFLFLSKKEVFSIPLIGTAMKRMGFIPVDRGSHRKAIQSILRMSKELDSGKNILLYPEGTRDYKSDQLLPFKSGFMSLAMKSKALILPIVTFDTKKIYSPAKRFRISPQTLKINVLDPIDMSHEIHPANRSSTINQEERLERIRELMQRSFNDLKNGKNDI